MRALIKDFLAQKRIAVVGVGRDPQSWGRTLYNEFQKRGYETFAINPNPVEGIKTFASLRDLPVPVDGVLLSVPPQVTDQVVREVAALGIPRVWMHRSAGPGAVSQAAIEFCKQNNIATVYGVCPFMYLQPQGFGHKLHYMFAKWMKSIPDGA